MSVNVVCGTASDGVYKLEVAVYSLHWRQYDYLVCVTAGYYRVSRRVSVSQGLGFTVAASVLVGDDNGLDALSLDLLGVHDQVGIRVAEAFLGDDNAIAAEVFSQLSGPVGGTLFVSQVYVLVCDDHANEVQVICQVAEQEGKKIRPKQAEQLRKQNGKIDREAAENVFRCPEKSRAEKKTVRIWIDAGVYNAYLADVGEADVSEIMEKALKMYFRKAV